jgi:hypothetical protein
MSGMTTSDGCVITHVGADGMGMVILPPLTIAWCVPQGATFAYIRRGRDAARNEMFFLVIFSTC